MDFYREKPVYCYLNHWLKNQQKILLTADSAPAALCAVEYLKGLGYDIIAVSGAMTSSPLYVREFQMKSNIPVISSGSNGSKMFGVLSKSLTI